jgi:hypothetical protein
MFTILAGWGALLHLERGSARLCRPFEGMMFNIPPAHCNKCKVLFSKEKVPYLDDPGG